MVPRFEFRHATEQKPEWRVCLRVGGQQRSRLQRGADGFLRETAAPRHHVPAALARTPRPETALCMSSLATSFGMETAKQDGRAEDSTVREPKPKDKSGRVPWTAGLL